MRYRALRDFATHGTVRQPMVHSGLSIAWRQREAARSKQPLQAQATDG